MEIIKNNLFQKGGGEVAGIVGLIVIVAIIMFVLYFFGVSFGVESEGIVKYDDCRQIITIQDNSWQKYLMKFTCNYIKSPTGKIIGGECVHITNDYSLLGSSNACKKAYIYQRNPDVKCPDMVNGFLDTNGVCKCNQGYEFNTASNKCELPTDTNTNMSDNITVPSKTPNTTSAIPTKVGECSKTTVSKIGTRLTDGTTGQNIAGSGSEIEYANGIIQVSYDNVQGIEDALIGDNINLCLVSIPTDCPAGDNRGRVYTALDERTGHTWQASDSEHSCGGA